MESRRHNLLHHLSRPRRSVDASWSVEFYDAEYDEWPKALNVANDAEPVEDRRQKHGQQILARAAATEAGLRQRLAVAAAAAWEH